jgi:hypothetical protein
MSVSKWSSLEVVHPSARDASETRPIEALPSAANTIGISRLGLVLSLWFIVFGLCLAHIVFQYAHHVLGYDRLFGLIPKFDLGGGANVPVWYQSLSMLFCALLLAFIAVARNAQRARFVRHWQGLSLIFLYLSLDEASTIHEATIVPLRHALRATGLFYYPWVLLGAAFALMVLIAYLRFLAHLPPPFRWLFPTAGAIYLSGAIGMEMLSGAYSSLRGQNNMTYSLYVLLEEFLEMAGIVTFISALLGYLGAQLRPLRIRVDA